MRKVNPLVSGFLKNKDTRTEKRTRGKSGHENAQHKIERGYASALSNNIYVFLPFSIGRYYSFIQTTKRR